MAERYSVSEDGLLYEFVLKQRLKFSNGNPVLASDFKWSWERALQPETGSRRAEAILGSIQGAQSMLDGATTELTGVTVVDDRNLHVHLTKPRGDFLYLLADPVAAVLSRKNVENWGVQWKVLQEGWEPGSFILQELPVGTGPFKLIEFDLFNNKCVLARNEHYHDSLAHLDTVELVMELPGEGFLFDRGNAAFEQGELDMTWYQSISADQKAPNVQDENGSVIFQDAAPEAYFLTFNSSIAPYDDVHFRKALVAASQVADWSRWWGDTLAHGLLPPEFLDDENLRANSETGFDAASKALSKSSYGNSANELELTFTSPSGGLEEEYGTLFQQWEDTLDVDAEYDVVSASRYREAFDNGAIEMKDFAVFMRYPDPHALMLAFDSTFGPTPASAEYEEIESRLSLASEESDAAQRLAL